MMVLTALRRSQGTAGQVVSLNDSHSSLEVVREQLAQN